MRRLSFFTRQKSFGRTQPDRGVTTVELSIVMMVFLTIVFGMLELSVAVFQYHVVSQAARHGARLASVRGELAGLVGEWNPAMGNPHVVSLSADDPVANAIRPYMAGIIPSLTTVALSWPDGTNELESPVQFEVQTVHQPFVTFLFTSSWTLTARSTMPVNH
jgi:hypothetical protein